MFYPINLWRNAQYKFTALYIAAIVVANIGFTYLPMIPLPGGEMLAPMSFLIGFVFVIRDFSQREIGHKVLIAMAIFCWPALPLAQLVVVHILTQSPLTELYYLLEVLQLQVASL